MALESIIQTGVFEINIAILHLVYCKEVSRERIAASGWDGYSENSGENCARSGKRYWVLSTMH